MKVTARGVLSLALAYALIVKMVFASVAVAAVVPGPGQRQVLCQTEAAGLPSHDGSSGPIDPKGCDDCTLNRLACLPGPDLASSIVAMPTSAAEAAIIRWSGEPDAQASPVAWRFGRGQRAPPATPGR